MPTYVLKPEYRHPEGQPTGREELLDNYSQFQIVNLLSIRGFLLSPEPPAVTDDGTNIFTKMFSIVK